MLTGEDISYRISELAPEFEEHIQNFRLYVNVSEFESEGEVSIEQLLPSDPKNPKSRSEALQAFQKAYDSALLIKELNDLYVKHEEDEELADMHDVEHTIRLGKMIFEYLLSQDLKKIKGKK